MLAPGVRTEQDLGERPALPSVRGRQRRPARAVSARLPGARVLVAPPAPGAGRARLARVGAGPARLRRDRSARRAARSTRPSSLMDDVAGLIDASGARETLLIGHDWGGVIAWLFALRRDPPAVAARGDEPAPPGVLRARAAPRRAPVAALLVHAVLPAAVAAREGARRARRRARSAARSATWRCTRRTSPRKCSTCTAARRSSPAHSPRC